MNINLYLDIDGVLNAYSAFAHGDKHRAWPNYEKIKHNSYQMIHSPSVVESLNQLITEHDITPIWLTTWEDMAAGYGRRIGLAGSENWEWLDTSDRDGRWGKFVSIKEHAAKSFPEKAIWIDDDLRDEHDAALWAAENGILALAPHGAHGITQAMIRQMHNYAEGGMAA